MLFKKNMQFRVGIDIGSTTIKLVALDHNDEVIFKSYERHNGAHKATLLPQLVAMEQALGASAQVLVAITGSQGAGIAQAIGGAFIQEVIAQSIAVKKLYPSTRTSIELGGQDSKMVFYADQPGNAVSDMRMNGVCAGGTGAFIDQMAMLLDIPVEQFNDAASRGSHVYDISGRCGVFAKTDIQPLLNQGVAKDDIALSCLHALAKQTIGGPGGPFFFIPKLVDVFSVRCKLTQEQMILPGMSQMFIAFGTALSLSTELGKKTRTTTISAIATALEHQVHGGGMVGSNTPFFTSTEEQKQFVVAHTPPAIPDAAKGLTGVVPVYIGLDAGSTTTKLVAINERGEVIFSFYRNNQGKPVDTARDGLLAFLDKCEKIGIEPDIRGLGTTGYGEFLFCTAFTADYHTVETIAHKEAALHFCPEVSFVLDLGGQDMKAIFIRNGIITNIVLNEACSAGCGSFIETYAKTLGIEPSDIAARAFSAHHPSDLGSRCTVFMNSSVISEQRNGRSVDEILAGLCRSIVENIFTKVVRIANFDELGEHIVVQGGTFKNDAVLKAFEDYIGRTVLRPAYSGEMGAYGIALLCREKMKESGAPSKAAALLTREQLEKFSYQVSSNDRCQLCSNNCARHIVTFSHGGSFVTGNRCERGAAIGNDAPVRARQPGKHVPDLVKERYRLLFAVASKKDIPAVITAEDKVIGIPRVLDFFDSFPFWAAFFKHLGYKVLLSDESGYTLFESGLRTVPSDTVCLPAKLAHGHIESLVERGVKTIFMPRMLKNKKENNGQDDTWYCAVLQGYPEIIRLNGALPADGSVRFLAPAFKFTSNVLRERQLVEFAAGELQASKQVVVAAIKKGDAAQLEFEQVVLKAGSLALADIRASKTFGVVIAGRPYHDDPFVNHSIAAHFTRQGIPVIVNEALPGLSETDLSFSRIDTINTFHNRMLAAAKFVAEHPELEMVQLVSFGCGHDAILTDELNRILRLYGGKEMLTLKLDEGENTGPLNIRITSFIETLKTQRSRRVGIDSARRFDPFPIKFGAGDKATKTFLLPNLTWGFSMVMAKAFERQGYTSQILPVAGKEAIAMGKRYVNNDICYPAQLNIGEILLYLKEHPEKADTTAAALAKNCNDCRACHYAALARKALDDAGFPQVPIVTTAEHDRRNMHPGMKMNRLRFSIDVVRGIALIDALDDMARMCRPYESVKGQAEVVYEASLRRVIGALSNSWRSALYELSAAVGEFNALEKQRTVRKPRVGIIGEILVNFHDAGNHRIVQYLEEHGMEVVLPNLIEFWRQETVNFKVAANQNHIRFSWLMKQFATQYGNLFKRIIRDVETCKQKFVWYQHHSDIHEIARKASTVFDTAFRTGEGWLIPGEIVNWIDEGISSFLIVQPFGCLPNHISGKGVVKSIKARYPHVQILTLDFDPDTSMANVHNRLQMIVLGASSMQEQ